MADIDVLPDGVRRRARPFPDANLLLLSGPNPVGASSWSSTPTGTPTTGAATPRQEVKGTAPTW